MSFVILPTPVMHRTRRSLRRTFVTVEEPTRNFRSRTSARSTFWLLGCGWCLRFSFRINRRFLRSVDRLNGYIAGRQIISRPRDLFRVIIKNDRLFETLNLSISDRQVLLMINQKADLLMF